MKRNIVIALDVGGTFIKTCIVENHLPLLASQRQFPSLADQDKEIILDQFMNIFKSQFELYHSHFKGHELDCHWHIGLAFPGPFDFKQGICYVQGLGKFESLYGVNLKKAFYERMEQEVGAWAKQLQRAEICFEHDARLFALGVSLDFPQQRFIALTLGTGLGSAYIDHSQVSDQVEGIPANGWLYNQPYRDGIIDEAFSKRGVLQLAMDLGALQPGMDVKELAESARLGNISCKEVFSEFGKRLAEMLIPYIKGYEPDLIVLGGQISKTYDLFGNALQDHLKPLQVQIHTSENLLEKTFIGISLMFDK
jgi:glucokinase